MRQKTHQELLQKIKELEHECNQLRQENKNAANRDKYIKEILDNIPAPIYLKDAHGNYKRVNKKYEELAGVKLADIVGKNDFDIFPQPVAELFRSQDEEVIQHGTPLEFEETIPLADGIHTYITSKFPLHGEDGTISAVGGFCTDITIRKQAEESLEQEHFLLQSVMNGAKKSHLVYLDRDFNFVRVNETYATTCGFSPEEMIGKNHFTLYPHDENEAIFARVRDTGEPFEVHDKPFEFSDQPERGVTYWDWTLIPEKDETGQTKGLIFSLFETTKRKKAELALQKIKAELEKRVQERTAELENKKLHLEETNIALKVLLQQMKKNKNEVEKTVYNNLEKLIFPYLEKLKQEISEHNDNSCLDILESNFQNITELFSPGLSQQISKLTPSELQIANLIKHGKTTKEIAEFLNLSIRTINFHRENIRNKLDLKNKQVNLRSHLMTIN